MQSATNGSNFLHDNVFARWFYLDLSWHLGERNVAASAPPPLPSRIRNCIEIDEGICRLFSALFCSIFNNYSAFGLLGY